MATRDVTLLLRVDPDQARKALKGVGRDFDLVEKKAKSSTSTAQKGLMRTGRTGQQAFGNMRTQVQGSTAAVSNLSRIVEDAPFGVRGVTNNINPFIQSFQQMSKQAGSTSAAMKSLLVSAFTGPGALLTISALITSAMTAIQMGLLDWGDEADSTDEKMENLLTTIDDFIEETAQLGGENVFDPLGQATTQEKLNQLRGLREELQTLFDLRKDAEELRSIIFQLRTAGTDVGGSREFLTEQVSRLQQVNSRLEEQERLFGRLSAAQEKQLQTKIDDLVATQELNQALIDLNASLQMQQTLNSMLRPALRDLELGLSGAEKEVRSLRKAFQQNVEHLRDQIESGEIHGKELEELKELMFQYQQAVEQADQALKDLNKQQKKAAEVSRPELQLPADVMPGRDDISGLLPSGSFEGAALPGTVEFQKRQLQNFQAAFDRATTAAERARLAELIKNARNELERMREPLKEVEGGLEDVGDQGQQSINATEAAVRMLGDALTQAIIRGEELGGVLKSLAAQLASRAIMTALQFLLPGSGAVMGETSFFSKMFGFAHGTDDFPGMGIVGERGPELLVAPPGSSIINNRNSEMLANAVDGARHGATNVQLQGELIDYMKMEQAMTRAIEGAQLETEQVQRGEELVNVIRLVTKRKKNMGASQFPQFNDL